MEKRKYIEPNMRLSSLLEGDVLLFSNDGSEFNDEENYFEDSYLG